MGTSGNSKFIRAALLSTVCLLVSACGGGGGGGGPQPIPIAPPAPPPPAPPPTPTPPPPPPGPDYNTQEYHSSTGPLAANALAAYNAGATGAGVTIGLIDYSRPDPNSPEFIGRIHPASQDLVGANRINHHAHGPFVASVAGANRDGSQMHGMAFDAKLLTLDVSAIECARFGLCWTDVPAMVRAIDVAVANGARVISFSVGAGPDFANPELAAAAIRAAQAGVVMVYAAGNAGNDFPHSYARQMADLMRPYGNVIIAGGHDTSRESIYDRAGTYQEFIAALATEVSFIRIEGDMHPGGGGTSASAPLVSGAVALLASAFPNLSGGQIAEILFKSADDVGAPGFDPVFGNGILNLARAFEPIGTTQLAGSSLEVSEVAGGALSETMGDAGINLSGVVALDVYSRAFTMDLTPTLQRPAQARTLMHSMQPGIRSVAANAGPASVRITLQGNPGEPRHSGLARASIFQDDAPQSRAVSGMMLTRLSHGTAVAVGFSEGARSLQQQLTHSGGGGFLLAGDPLGRHGFYSSGQRSAGVRQVIGGTVLTVVGEAGEVHQWRARQSKDRYSLSSIAADRRVGPIALTLGASRLDEERTLLGGRFAFGGGATTYFADAAAGVDLGPGWAVGGSYRRGWTRMSGASGLVTGGKLSSDAFSLDLSRRALLTADDRIAFRVMQPLRVRGGGYDLKLPVSYDYADSSVGYERRRLNLAPSGRELVLEASYNRSFLEGAGSLSLNSFVRRNPGHIASARPDVGGVLRLTLDW